MLNPTRVSAVSCFLQQNEVVKMSRMDNTTYAKGNAALADRLEARMGGIPKATSKATVDTHHCLGPAIRDRVAKLALYKECMLLARASDRLQRKRTIMDVRETWRAKRGAVGLLIPMALGSCLERIAYGRMCVERPKLKNIKAASLNYDWGSVNEGEYYHKMRTKRAENNTGRKFVLGEDPNTGRHARDFVPITNWGLGNMDPDVIRTHQKLTERGQFMGPTWRGKPKPDIYEDLTFEEQLVNNFNCEENTFRGVGTSLPEWKNPDGTSRW